MQICVAYPDKTANISNVALGIDIRSGASIDEFLEELKKVNEMGVKFEILFLNASNRILIKRYKETRRNHPLARNGRIEDGIEKEREAVDVLKKHADYVIDTSQLLTRELKAEIDRIFVREEEYANFNVAVVSFGFKFGYRQT